MVIEVNPYKASSISKALTLLKAYRYRITQFPHAFIEAVANRFDEILQEEAPFEAAGMWEKGEVEDTGNSSKVIFTFKGEVEFIEFGTGIVGKENHEGANMEWAEKLPPPYTGYESGPKINPITHIWWYWGGSGFIPTKGQVANPFIYRSVTRLKSESTEIAQQVLRMIENGNGQA